MIASQRYSARLGNIIQTSCMQIELKATHDLLAEISILKILVLVENLVDLFLMQDSFYIADDEARQPLEKLRILARNELFYIDDFIQVE